METARMAANLHWSGRILWACTAGPCSGTELFLWLPRMVRQEVRRFAADELRLSLGRFTARHDRLLARRNVEDIFLIQVYRFGSPLPRHLDRRLKLIGGSAASNHEIGLDCRSAQ